MSNISSAKLALAKKGKSATTVDEDEFQFTDEAQEEPNEEDKFWESVGDIRQNLAIAIKTERKNQGLSQRKLACLARCSQCTIARVEKSWTSLPTILRVVAALGKELTLK